MVVKIGVYHAETMVESLSGDSYRFLLGIPSYRTTQHEGRGGFANLEEGGRRDGWVLVLVDFASVYCDDLMLVSGNGKTTES